MPIDFTPRYCQELMRDWILAHNRCNVWASPGTGKTGACYTAADILKLLGSRFTPWLILGPKKVALDVWPREQKKWNQFRDLRIVTLAGLEEYDCIRQLRRAAKGELDAIVVNYDRLIARYNDKGKRTSFGLIDYFMEDGREWPFRGVIADESTKLKGFRLKNGAKRAMALAYVAKHVGRWINLTGTPSPNGLLDLWGQQWFVDRGARLGRTFTEYQRKFFYQDPDTDKWVPFDGAAEEIARRLADCTISIQAKDYFDLPPIIVNDVPVRLNAKAMQQYKRMERELFTELDNGEAVDAQNAAVKTQKCLQMASGAIYTHEAGEKIEYTELDDSKRYALEHIMAEAGVPVLVAFQWKFDRDRLLKWFPGAREIKTSQDIDDFNAGKINPGIAHPASTAHGIDLARGTNIGVFYSQWWNLEEYMQFIERFGPTRQAQHGLNRPVFLHHLIGEGTLEEDVVQRRYGKRTVQETLIERMRK